MPISRDTKIKDIEFEPTPSGKSKGRRFQYMLADFETYGELVDRVKENGGALYVAPSIGPRRAEKLEAFIAQNPPIEDVRLQPSTMHSFNIITPNMPLEEKLRAATAGVDKHLIGVAVDQFKRGAVVIEP